MIDEKGGKAVDTEVFDAECSRLAEVDLRQVVATGACLDAKEQAAFVYDVFFKAPSGACPACLLRPDPADGPGVAIP